MKKFTIEEKAQRYDEAIELAKEINDEQRAQPFDVMLKVFPELKESDDERIRKAIKLMYSFLPNKPKYIGDVSVEDMFAWLEKQGEHANFRNKIQIGDKVTRNKDGVLVNLSQLNRVAKKGEKQGEQKPADKVEPIVVRDFNSVFSKEQVEEIDKRIEESQRLYNAKLRDAMRKVEDFPMTD